MLCSAEIFPLKDFSLTPQPRGRVFELISNHREAVSCKNEAQPCFFLTDFQVFGNRIKHSFERLM